MSFFICSNCGYGSASWYGKCPECNQWNTLVEKPNFNKPEKEDKKTINKITITSLKNIKSQPLTRIKTNIFEFDRVLGNGFVKGEVILLTGEPGIGKSTLILQTLTNLKTLYISGEETAEQIKLRAERLKINLDNFLFSDDLQVEGIVEGVNEIKDKIDLVVIDSIQTIYSKNIDGAPASISQIKEVAKQLINLAKKTYLPIFIIGHITKEGEIAGPKTLEHYVDCVLNFEGEKNSNYRLLRSSKNRFGSTDEIGVFQMTQHGLKEVNNPLIFLDNQNKTENQSGKAIIGVNQGKRVFFFEIQTLVSYTNLAIPRRIVNGLDYNKVLLTLAVLKKNLKFNFENYDVYVNVVGGITIKNPIVDLGLAASLISSIKNISIKPQSLFIGEIGLLGEVRKTITDEKIINEAKRLGFKYIYSGNNIDNIKSLIKVIQI